MALAIMGAPFGLARAHRQERLGAVERLNLEFLIHTEDQSPLGRCQITSYNILHFLYKERIRRQLERLQAVRL